MFKKIPDTFVIIFVLIVIAAALTWVVPGGEYIQTEEGSQQFEYRENSPQSWQVFTAFQKGFIKQAGIIIFVLIVGGVFWIFNTTQAIDVGIYALLRKMKKLEGSRLFSPKLISNAILVFISLVFSVFGAVFGMSEETIAFVGIVIPLAISLGYDSIVGLCVVFVAAGLGFAGAVLNPFTIGIAQGIAGLPLFSGIEYRLFCWLIINLVGIGYILWYANRVHARPEKSLVYAEDEYWRKRNATISSTEYYTPKRAWVIYGLSLVVMVIFAALYPETDIKIGNASHQIPALIILAALFGVLGFLSLLKSVHYFVMTILLFIILYLTVGVMGFNWYINEIAGLFLAGGIITGITIRKTGNEIVKLFMEGARDIAGAALVIGLAGGIIVILEDGRIVHSILHSAAGLMNGLGKIASVQTMYVIQTFINIIIPSGSAKAAITMPIMAPFSDLIGISRQATVMAFQLGDGFTNMITPISPVLMGVLAVSRIPYVKWLKWILPLMVMLIILGALLLIPTVTMQLNGF
ncbi:MAG: YfcC family protein [Bacteroidota bacterium]|nr:MAG: YfcC family protein [Bacteroidota bacterium]